MPFLIVGSVLLLLLLVAFFFAQWSFRKAFFVTEKQRNIDPHQFLGGEKDQIYKEPMLQLMYALEARPFERVSIRSRDGLTLSGRLYFADGESDVLEIFFHGWRGSTWRDGCGAAQLAQAAGHHLLLVDQRAHGESEGKVITFGILEKYDCLDWANFAVERFGPDIRILLGGVSMGAATVLMASALPLPAQVKGISADCGYTSPEAIIRKVCRDMGFSDRIGYPFVRLSARLFGGFSMPKDGAVDAIAQAKVPILLMHGKTDDFVPFSMGEALYAAADPDKTTLFAVEDAGHGLAFFYDNEGYVQAVRAYQERALGKNE